MTAAARVVLVSGAASGIGAATARRFAEGGDHVALVDIDGAHAKAVADQLTEIGATVEAFECDVTDAAAVDELMSGVLERFGRLDVACNNAGRDGGTRLPFEDVPLDTFDAVMSLNARAVFVCMQREIAAMRG